MIGQTAEIAPADRKLYALRDVTGTVESPYLICASIMSKKLAEGIDALVLDVKTGSGAFMKSEKDAAFLAELMVETGERMGKQVVALITDMDQPLGRMIGNALEVVEVVEVLRGAGPQDLRELCLELGGLDAASGRCRDTVAEGKKQSAKLIASGKALERFRQMVELQGGDPRVIDDPKRLPQAQTHDDDFESEGRISGVIAVRASWNRMRDSRRRPRTKRRLRRSGSRDRPSQKSWRCCIRWGATGDDSLQCRNSRGTRQTITRGELSDFRCARREKRPLIHRVIGKTGEKN